MIKDLHINYGLIQKALDFYQNIGYELINVDWMVEPEYSFATHSEEFGKFITKNSKGEDRHLVGSAEQGFIQAVARQEVQPDKKYVSVSPCFRRGDIGPYNHEWFMKIELSAISRANDTIWMDFIDDAWTCFESLGAYETNMHLWQIHPINNIDIVYDFPQMGEAFPWLELGSYGRREINLSSRDLQKMDCMIHYGTGLALPRFQLILP